MSKGNTLGRPIVVSPEALLRLAREKGGICAAKNDILRELVGFRPIGAVPYLDTIKVAVLNHTMLRKMLTRELEDDDYEEMDLYTLFIRRPPYEPETYPPIDLRPTGVIIGSYIWFVKPSSGSIGNWDMNNILILNDNKLMTQLADNISNIVPQANVNSIKNFFRHTGIIGYGKVKRRSKGRLRTELKVLFIPSLLEHVTPHQGKLPEVRVKLAAGHQSNIHIVYGIDGELLRDNGFKHVRLSLKNSYKKYMEQLSKGEYLASRTWLRDMINVLACSAASRRIKYDVGNFNYVSYCALGHYMTTFPLAPKASCPYCKHVRRSSFCIPMFNGQRFSWRRQAFPKVYPRFNSKADLHGREAGSVALPFSAIDLTNVRILLTVDGIDMFVPEVGKVSIDFEVELEELLHNTNGVFVLIPDSVTSLLVDALLTSARQGCSIKDTSETTDLLGLLLTKFVVSNIGLFNLADALNIDPKKGVTLSNALLSQYIQHALRLQNKPSDLKEVYNNLINMQARSIRRMFTRYIEDVLAHTIAHVLYILVREDPDIPEENIAYIYGKFFPSAGPVNRIVYAGVYERSKYGVLQLDKEIAKSLKNQAAKYCHTVGSLTEAVQCMLVVYFEEAEKQYMFMHKRQPLRGVARHALNNYHSVVTGYKPWLDAGLSKDIVNELRSLVKSVYAEFKRLGFELDFPSFNFIIMQKKEDIKRYLVEYIKNKLSGKMKVGDEEIEDAVEAMLRETLQNAILAEGPEYCLDGCYVNIHLERMCTKAVEENLHVSWELLRLFLYLTGLLRSKPGSKLRPTVACSTGPGAVKVVGRSILYMLQQASKRVKIGSAYVNAEAVKFVEELLKRGVSVSMVVDERSCSPSSPDDPCKMLYQLKQRYGDLFKYSIAGKEMFNTHEKEYVIDNLRIYTSWNLLVGTPPPSVQRRSKGPVAQSYIAEYIAKGEE